MAYWFCPACHRSLYGRSHKVQSCPACDAGNCLYCGAPLHVQRQKLLWLLAFVGWLAYFIIAVVDRDLLTNAAAHYLAIDITPQAFGYIALALQCPLLILGPRYEAAPTRS